jgi:hypothetical protein
MSMAKICDQLTHQAFCVAYNAHVIVSEGNVTA